MTLLIVLTVTSFRFQSLNHFPFDIYWFWQILNAPREGERTSLHTAVSPWELLEREVRGCVPDCKGSREITALTDSHGKLSDRTNKERKKENKLTWERIWPVAGHMRRFLSFFLSFKWSFSTGIFCTQTHVLLPEEIGSQCCWNYVNGLM